MKRYNFTQVNAEQIEYSCEAILRSNWLGERNIWCQQRPPYQTIP